MSAGLCPLELPVPTAAGWTAKCDLSHPRCSQVTLEIPGWLRFVSEGAISSTGSKVGCPPFPLLPSPSRATLCQSRSRGTSCNAVAPHTVCRLGLQSLPARRLHSCLVDQPLLTSQPRSWLHYMTQQMRSQSSVQVMQKVLNTMVPRFLAQLAADYDLWAAGDESRKPIGTGRL